MSSATSATKIGLFAAFASLGVTAAFVPAMLPAAQEATGRNLAVAVPVLFAGLLAGVLISAPLLSRRPSKHVLILGGALQAAAIVAIACTTSAGVFIAAAAVAGLGFGMVETAGSVATKTLVAGSTTGLLSALMGTVAVCAALTPLIVAAVSAVLPALSALALIPLALVVMFSVRSQTETTLYTAPRERVEFSRRTILLLVPFALSLPLYVGVETILSGWSAVIPERALGLDPTLAALGTSAFWTLMAVGRFGAMALRRNGVAPLVLLGFGTGCGAVLLAVASLVVAANPVVALIAIAVAIVSVAPSYALILGLTLDRLSTAQGKVVTGILVACGVGGGTCVPMLVLLIAKDPASSTTFAIAAALCAAVPILVVGGAGLWRRAETRS